VVRRAVPCGLPFRFRRRERIVVSARYAGNAHYGGLSMKLLRLWLLHRVTVMALTFTAGAAFGEGVAATRPAQVATRALRTRELRDATGNLIETHTFYINPEGEEVREGAQVQWYSNGQKHREIRYHDGIPDGDQIEWDLSGAKESECHYRHGLKTGSETTWGPLGRKSSECIYKDGRIVGKKTFWFDNGVVAKEETYDQSGKLSDVMLFHPNGKRKVQGHFGGRYEDTKFLWNAAGNLKKEGRWSYWDDQGKLLAEGEFRDGQPWEGICGTVDRSQSVPMERFGRYEKGKLIEHVKAPH
jgi:antitoxin component YwqK of YwqJK toxin-antitoxin module